MRPHAQDAAARLRMLLLGCTGPHASAAAVPFGCADKPAEKHCWLICCERKILFQLKKQAEKDGL
jgi:hypothetical protein